MKAADIFRSRNALIALSAVALPLKLGVTIARWRHALSLLVDPIQEARKSRFESAADRDHAGNAVVGRNSGALAFNLSPEAEYAIEKEFAAVLSEYLVVTCPADFLRVSDFPATIAGKEFAIEPSILADLGPLLLLD